MGILGEVADAIGELLRAIWNAIEAVVTAFYRGLKYITSAIYSAIAFVCRQIYRAIATLFSLARDACFYIFAHVLKPLWNTVVVEFIWRHLIVSWLWGLVLLPCCIIGVHIIVACYRAFWYGPFDDKRFFLDGILGDPKPAEQWPFRRLVPPRILVQSFGIVIGFGIGLRNWFEVLAILVKGVWYGAFPEYLSFRDVPLLRLSEDKESKFWQQTISRVIAAVSGLVLGVRFLVILVVATLRAAWYGPAPHLFHPHDALLSPPSENAASSSFSKTIGIFAGIVFGIRTYVACATVLHRGFCLGVAPEFFARESPFKITRICISSGDGWTSNVARLLCGSTAGVCLGVVGFAATVELAVAGVWYGCVGKWHFDGKYSLLGAPKYAPTSVFGRVFGVFGLVIGLRNIIDGLYIFIFHLGTFVVVSAARGAFYGALPVHAHCADGLMKPPSVPVYRTRPEQAIALLLGSPFGVIFGWRPIANFMTMIPRALWYGSFGASISWGVLGPPTYKLQSRVAKTVGVLALAGLGLRAVCDVVCTCSVYSATAVQRGLVFAVTNFGDLLEILAFAIQVLFSVVFYHLIRGIWYGAAPRKTHNDDGWLSEPKDPFYAEEPSQSQPSSQLPQSPSPLHTSILSPPLAPSTIHVDDRAFPLFPQPDFSPTANSANANIPNVTPTHAHAAHANIPELVLPQPQHEPPQSQAGYYPPPGYSSATATQFLSSSQPTSPPLPPRPQPPQEVAVSFPEPSAPPQTDSENATSWQLPTEFPMAGDSAHPDLSPPPSYSAVMNSPTMSSTPMSLPSPTPLLDSIPQSPLPHAQQTSSTEPGLNWTKMHFPPRHPIIVMPFYMGAALTFGLGLRAIINYVTVILKGLRHGVAPGKMHEKLGFTLDPATTGFKNQYNCIWCVFPGCILGVEGFVIVALATAMGAWYGGLAATPRDMLNIFSPADNPVAKRPLSRAFGYIFGLGLGLRVYAAVPIWLGRCAWYGYNPACFHTNDGLLFPEPSFDTSRRQAPTPTSLAETSSPVDGPPSKLQTSAPYTHTASRIAGFLFGGIVGLRAILQFTSAIPRGVWYGVWPHALHCADGFMPAPPKDAYKSKHVRYIIGTFGLVVGVRSIIQFVSAIPKGVWYGVWPEALHSVDGCMTPPTAPVYKSRRPRYILGLFGIIVGLRAVINTFGVLVHAMWVGSVPELYLVDGAISTTPPARMQMKTAFGRVIGFVFGLVVGLRVYCALVVILFKVLWTGAFGRIKVSKHEHQIVCKTKLSRPSRICASVAWTAAGFGIGYLIANAKEASNAPVVGGIPGACIAAVLVVIGLRNIFSLIWIDLLRYKVLEPIFNFLIFALGFIVFVPVLSTAVVVRKLPMSIMHVTEVTGVWTCLGCGKRFKFTRAKFYKSAVRLVALIVAVVAVKMAMSQSLSAARLGNAIAIASGVALFTFVHLLMRYFRNDARFTLSIEEHNQLRSLIPTEAEREDIHQSFCRLILEAKRGHGEHDTSGILRFFLRELGSRSADEKKLKTMHNIYKSGAIVVRDVTRPLPADAVDPRSALDELKKSAKKIVSDLKGVVDRHVQNKEKKAVRAADFWSDEVQLNAGEPYHHIARFSDDGRLVITRVSLAPPRADGSGQLPLPPSDPFVVVMRAGAEVIAETARGAVTRMVQEARERREKSPTRHGDNDPSSPPAYQK